MIYATPFEGSGYEMQCTGPSVDSGFKSLEEVKIVMGPACVHDHPRIVMCDQVAFSDFIFCVDESGNND